MTDDTELSYSVVEVKEAIDLLKTTKLYTTILDAFRDEIKKRNLTSSERLLESQALSWMLSTALATQICCVQECQLEDDGYKDGDTIPFKRYIDTLASAKAPAQERFDNAILDQTSVALGISKGALMTRIALLQYPGLTDRKDLN